MPRNISGNYTLPAGNPVVNGTVIDITWGNGTMNDIALQLNNVLTRDGILGPTAPVKFPSGTPAAPGITFSADTALGFYRAASNTLGFAAGGLAWATLNGTGNWVFTAASAGNTLTTPDITVTGTANLNGTTNIGDAASDVTTFAGSTITWSNNPTHTGNHTFSGTASGVLPSTAAQFATKAYVDSVAIATISQSTAAIAVCGYLGLF